MFNNFTSKNHFVYEIMWKNTVEPDRPQMTKKKNNEKSFDLHGE